MSTDPFHLQRFLDAQSGIYNQALGELRAGEKRSHWMWFIFPQIKGLGSSPTAQRYAIGSREEAAAYLDHPVLGQRLRQCTEAVLAVEGRSVSDIFGYPDDLKFHSSITLFADAAKEAEHDATLFSAALTKFFAGRPDRATLNLL